ncbi:MAG: hypothetical protein M1812_005238 [Candelaria pacifica]|nr:MAG: hypothetical protein M1812_005238 [Candelaria pacifica]
MARRSKKSFPFLKLPGGVRNRIYCLALIPRTKGNTAVLTLNHQIHDEALTILYANTVFDCMIFGVDLNIDGPGGSPQARDVWEVFDPFSPKPSVTHMDLVKKCSLQVLMPTLILGVESLPPAITHIYDHITETCTPLTHLLEIHIAYHDNSYNDLDHEVSEQDYIRAGQQALQGFKFLRGLEKVTFNAPSLPAEFLENLRQVMMGPKPTFPFLKLPPELRSAVYSIFDEEHPSSLPSILAVSRQLNEEVTYVLYSTTVFKYNVSYQNQVKLRPDGKYLLTDLSRGKQSRNVPASFLRHIKSIHFEVAVRSRGELQGRVGRFAMDVARVKKSLTELCSHLTTLRSAEILFSNGNHAEEVNGYRKARFLSKGQQALEPLKILRNLEHALIISPTNSIQSEYMDELTQTMMGP